MIPPQAESVIRQQLAIKETPTLLCYLGDVTRDRTHYQRAWEMSNHRSARAQRCLGYIYFHERDVSQLYTLIRFGPKVGQIDTNGTNPGLFQIRFQYIFRKRPGFVLFRADLTHFGPNSCDPAFLLD